MHKYNSMGTYTDTHTHTHDVNSFNALSEK